MAKDTIDVLVDGGKATAAPPLGPALGPMGVNIGQVVSEINKKTAEFKGMRVPVKVIIDKDTKSFEVRVGTPPASALIKKEANIDKGAGNPKIDKVADLKIEQIIRISKMKSDALLGKDAVAKVKEIIGTCNSMGVLVEGKPAIETLRDIEKGMFRDKILSGKTELTAEELKALEAEKIRLQAEIEARKAEYEAKAKAIISSMAGRPRGEIKTKLVEAGIPTKLIEQLLPVEGVAGAQAAGTGAAAKPEEKKA